jgi:WS/DGAT/MGAT family acyltransferase
MKLHRLSGFDTTMLRFENPRQPMHALSLAELDITTVAGGYDFQTFRDTLARRTRALPEFRAKLADTPLNLDTPVWVEDPDFDIDRHVHRLTVPAPGGRHELSAIAGRLAATPLDRDHPLWDIWLIEGVGGLDPAASGRLAAVIRTHHVFADGLTAGDLWAKMYAPETETAPTQTVRGFGTPSAGRIALDGLARFARRPWLLLTRVLPGLLLAVFTTVRRAVSGAGVMVSPFAAPPVPFNGNSTERRIVAYARLDLAEVKRVKNAFDVKVNDVLLAVIAGALRTYLQDRAELPDKPLVALVPMSIYDESRDSRNQFAPYWSALHTDVADPVARLKHVAQSSAAAKEHTAAIGEATLLNLAQCSPSTPTTIMRLYALSGLSRRYPVYNVSLSNVMLTQEQLLGARLTANYPFGPVMNGAGLNITATSLCGNIDIGLISCPELLPDLWTLADLMPAALAELLELAVAADTDDAIPQQR